MEHSGNAFAPDLGHIWLRHCVQLPRRLSVVSLRKSNGDRDWLEHSDAEETGPNPVDTYRPADIEKLGIRNATDLTTFLPQEAGGTVNLNIANGGDGTVQFNLRGLLPKETLVLVDGKRVAFGSLDAVGFSRGVDINLIPFPMIDHIDILKDGASAVYGSDAITGVVNFFLVHKFRGWRSEAVTGTQTWERLTTWASGRHGSKPAPEMTRPTLWSLPISGSVPAASSARDRDISSNAFQIPWGGFDESQREISLAALAALDFRLDPEHVFRPGRYSAARREHAASALSSERGNFSIL